MSAVERVEHMPTAERLRELLVGRKVVLVRMTDESPGHGATGPTGFLTLDDGVELIVWGNDGGCSCSAGCYPLSELNGCDNIITNVEVEEEPGGDDFPCRTCGKFSCHEIGHKSAYEGWFRVFVFAENRRVNLASFEGSDGNGYYGTGWWLDVRAPVVGKEAEA